jgi:hypothetical protein
VDVVGRGEAAREQEGEADVEAEGAAVGAILALEGGGPLAGGGDEVDWADQVEIGDLDVDESRAGGGEGGEEVVTGSDDVWVGVFEPGAADADA